MDMKIVRGTTPTFNFILPFSSEVDMVILTFMQNGEKINQFDRDRMVITPILTESENSDIIDNNKGDEFSSNDYDYSSEEASDEVYCNCAITMTEEETLAFGFYPAAEKNIVYSQFKIVSGDEVFVSDPVNFRVYGDLDGQARLGGRD